MVLCPILGWFYTHDHRRSMCSQALYHFMKVLEKDVMGNQKGHIDF